MIELLIILALVLLNGVLAMSEIAVVSARRARLEERIEQEDDGAARALELSEDPNRFLSTVQIGITLVGVMTGAFGGVTLGETFGVWIEENIPLLASYSRTIGVGLIVTLTTYMSLVLGELVPKRLAMMYPEKISAMIARPMHRMSIISAPIVWFLGVSTDAVVRLIGIQPDDEPSVSESEVLQMLEEGADEGVFLAEEAKMVEGVLELDDIPVERIMTPRMKILSLDLEAPRDTTYDQILRSPHTFYPVYKQDVEKIVGMVSARDLLTPLIHDNEIDLEALMTPPLFIPEVAPASRALEMFKSSGVHMGIVVDEHGGVNGLLTINDVLEEIVGDIDADDQNIVQRDDGSYSLDGQLSIARLSKLFEAFELPEQEVGNYQTLAGFVMSRLGRLPEIADTFEYQRMHFEVTDMDEARVDRVVVSELPEAEQAETAETEEETADAETQTENETD